MLAMPCDGKRVAILGDMAELGEDSDAAHAALIHLLREKPLDTVYLVGDAFKAGLASTDHDGRFNILDLEDLENILTEQLAPGDVVLVKGSNSTGLFQNLSKFRMS